MKKHYMSVRFRGPQKTINLSNTPCSHSFKQWLDYTTFVYFIEPSPLARS